MKLPTPQELQITAPKRIHAELQRFLEVIGEQLTIQWYGQSDVTMVFDTRNYPNALGEDFDLIVKLAAQSGWQLTKYVVDTGTVAVIISVIQQ